MQAAAIGIFPLRTGQTNASREVVPTGRRHLLDNLLELERGLIQMTLGLPSDADLQYLSRVRCEYIFCELAYHFPVTLISRLFDLV